MSRPTDVLERRAVGAFIRRLREARGLTQEQFSKIIGTTQSAVARLEKGEQNLTMETLAKMSAALERKIVTLSDSMDFKIENITPA